MKKNIFAFLAFAMVLLNGNLVLGNMDKPLGIGISAGDTPGPSLKYWLNKNNAIDLSVGFKKDPVVYSDYLWHAWDLFPEIKGGTLGGYIGLGGRIEFKSGPDNIGIRTPAGIDFTFEKRPVEIFLEIAPFFQVSPETDSDFETILGIRFYFGKK